MDQVGSTCYERRFPNTFENIYELIGLWDQIIPTIIVK